MTNIIIEFSKYLIIVLMAIYTYYSFSVFSYEDPDKREQVLVTQNAVMLLIHFTTYLVMFLSYRKVEYLYFYVAQVALFLTIILLYSIIYPKISRLVVNHMCMLLCIGLMMITRLDFSLGVKQYIVAAGATIFSLVVPVIIRRVKALADYSTLYGIVGIVFLAAVVAVGRVSGGALLGITIAGFSIQPSEFVKLIFVFYVASSLYNQPSFKQLVITTAVAALHVLILVISKDLGAALIIFVVYLVMLYVATRNPLYSIVGVAAGCGASIIAYKLFAHVRNRVIAWKDPFGNYNGAGYQISQSLFAIGTGGWFGMGLCQGLPTSIPVAESDFIFSAITEEMGVIFSLCLILLMISCYLMFLNIAMKLHNFFYKLVALGLGTCFMIQAFLNIGGVTKFIPSTGVTLPLVSYGGSSILSTMIMFAIIQGLYILREDEEEDIERRKAKQAKKEIRRAKRRYPDRNTGSRRRR